LDFEVIRQKRLQKFLVNCARAGEKTPLPLDATKQSNATFDTMMEVAVECETIGIPTPDRPYVTASMLPLPPTPETFDRNCVWTVFTKDQTCWTPYAPEDYGCSPNFPEVLASFLHYQESRNDGYYDDYDPEEDEYCVACPSYHKKHSSNSYYDDYDPEEDEYCVACPSYYNH
jgi:hypothetical protein